MSRERIINNKQKLLLDFNGYLIQSDDHLFSTRSIRKTPLISTFPFVLSIFDHLKTLKPGTPELQFKGVSTRHAFLPGYYDFLFSKKIWEGKEVIQWVVVDLTDKYQKMYDKQQERINQLLEKEKNSSKED